jgi:ABC-type multidrug transport system ATPase subunit
MTSQRMPLPTAASVAAVPLEEVAVMSFAGIWRSWGRGSRRRSVLRDVDLHLAPGEAVRVEGANGAGKTTLLRIGAGILRPDAGTVHLDGLPSEGSWREYHRRVGFLSAGDRGLYARFSVRGHLDYGARIAFLPRPERRRAVEDALTRFDLRELAPRRADRLSQGQRQRLRLALTVVHRPRVLLLDEPRNSLDGPGQAILADAVGDVLAAGGAVLWCSPAGEDQPVEFDRSYVIRDGTLEPA